jgi:septum formation protein
MPALVLASTSPRRRELLSLLGIPFEVDDPDFVETITAGQSPIALARSFALGKAQSCAAKRPGAVVVGSDTLIEVDGAVLGKPADSADARAMLRRLGGRGHLIHTAVAVVCAAAGFSEAGSETVHVRMRPFTDREIDDYVASGECLGKAGAYSIQGAGGQLIEGIAGDFPAAVGLPLRLTAGLLRKLGLVPVVDVEVLYSRKPYSNWARFSS